MERLFFGYAGADINVGECMRTAASKLAEFDSVEQALTWEDLRVDGKLIVNDILAAIDACTIGVFDLTSLNSNVLFELGVAIGAGKPVVITRDGDNEPSDRMFREFALLTTTGYTQYVNSSELLAKLNAVVAQPPGALLHTLLGESDNPILPDRLLYVPSMKEDEASVTLSRLFDNHKSLNLFTLELDEHGTSPLAWLAQQIYSSSFAAFHFTPREAYLSETSNRRCALLAGVAAGLGKQTRVIMSSSDGVAIDYRDLRIAYANAREVAERTEGWLSGLRVQTKKSGPARKHLPAELAALRFGNHVAEADAERLEEYFVETRDFLDVLEGTATVFTGRKGTGKTASMLQAATTLRDDARNLVCVIKPASYELEALSEVIGRIDVAHIGTYLLEGVWKYLLFTEVAAALVRDADGSPAGILNGSPIDQVRRTLDDSHGGIEASFAERLEDVVKNLNLNLNDITGDTDIESARAVIGRMLYGGNIRILRAQLTAAMASKRRVAILIDNLDKAWERGAALGTMSAIIFGLLTAVGRVSDEYAREAGGDSKKVRFTLTAFLRSDIYAYVREHAREPDKIATSEIEWRDEDLLARVLEDRFIASRGGKTKPDELWNQFFAPTIGDQPSREYILTRVQPRPRDLIFFANAAVLEATNARQHIIDAACVDKAEAAYSQFAYEALLVEGVAVGIDMEHLLLAFVGEKPRLIDRELRDVMQDAKIDPDVHDDYIRILREHGFLGIQVAPDRFDYGSTVGEIKKANVLASKLEKTARMSRTYEIHPSYRRHLVVEEGAAAG